MNTKQKVKGAILFTAIGVLLAKDYHKVINNNVDKLWNFYVNNSPSKLLECVEFFIQHASVIENIAIDKPLGTTVEGIKLADNSQVAWFGFKNSYIFRHDGWNIDEWLTSIFELEEIKHRHTAVYSEFILKTKPDKKHGKFQAVQFDNGICVLSDKSFYGSIQELKFYKQGHTIDWL